MERETILDQIQLLKVGLISASTDGSMDEKRYKDIRRTILGIPEMSGKIPSFLKSCQSPTEVRRLLQAEAPTYAERRGKITNGFAPLIEAIESGQEVFENTFTLGEEIGQGGFGRVFKVRHKYLEMDFAIKVFEPSFDDGRQSHIDRFFREARILFQLQHENIVRIYDAGMFGGKPFIKMELIEGESLNSRLREAGLFTGPESARIIKQVLHGLSFAHSFAKIVHRDIKPSNIMVSKTGRAKLIDFGLGTFVENELISRITKTGENIVGDVFTAPELLANPKLIDPKTDLYSIGAIWYTMVVGHPPRGSDIQTRLEELKTISLPTKRIILKCLSSANSRYNSCEEIILEIENTGPRRKVPQSIEQE